VVEGLVVRFGSVAAVDGVDLTVAAGEVTCLLGPSGCGKSTLLRAVAGLEPLAAGRITWDGEDLAGLPPHRRRLGMMFQDYALFPHLDVTANVAFGLRMQSRPRAEVAARAAEVLELVGMAHAGRRSVGRLSGGEQQRVALARALAVEPRLLLLDEPLGALDQALRARLLAELAELLERVGVTALHVTHDQDEAFSLGHRVALMDAGRLVQVGTPAQVWSAPETTFAARFLGFPVVPAQVVDGVAAGTWGEAPAPHGVVDGPAEVVLRPDALRLAGDGRLTGHVVSTAFRGDRVLVRVRTALGVVGVWASPGVAPAVGEEAAVAVDASRVVVLATPPGTPSAGPPRRLAP
jgi:thiamine transport system ATP-binding protein